MAEQRKGWARESVWLLLGLLVSSVWCISAATQLGATFDEPTYLRFGLKSWHTGSSKVLLDLGTMPLPCHVQTLPLYCWECWRGQRFDVERDLEQMLPVARMANLVFWWLLLVYGWRLGRQLAGDWGGRLAVLLLACEPNLLAHASLATTDLALTATLLAFWFHFRAGRGADWWKRVGIPAICLAVSVTCKASAPAFAVLGMAVIECQRRWQESRPTDKRPGRLWTCWRALTDRHYQGDAWQICLLGLALTFWYCGTDGLPSPSFVQWARQLPAGGSRTCMVWVAEHLCVFTNAGSALARQLRHNIQGQGAFLLGRVAPRAFWYYFPVALSIKMPVPLLLLPPLLALVCRRALAGWAFLMCLTLLVFSLTCRVQIGIRFMLPLISVLSVSVAAGIVQARGLLGPGWRRTIITCAGGAGCLWMVWAALSVWPHGLCYTNEIWGGTTKGYRCLSDSNYDWGQGLKDLARWQKENGRHDLDVLYYGTDPILRKLPMRSVPISSLQLEGPDRLPRSLQGHTLAVSTSLLFSSFDDNVPLKQLSTALRRVRPIARAATFLIYHFPTEQSLVIPRNDMPLSQME